MSSKPATVTLYDQHGKPKAKVPASQRLEVIAIPRPKSSLMSERNAAEAFGVVLVLMIFAMILVR